MKDLLLLVFLFFLFSFISNQRKYSDKYYELEAKKLELEYIKELNRHKFELNIQQRILNNKMQLKRIDSLIINNKN